ncbi:MAG: hypothetical protein ACOCXH_09870 [Cyclobacteriaceae bacterium]
MMKFFNFFKKRSQTPEFRIKYNTYDRGMQTEAQGGVWITADPNKITVPNTAEEVDFDKIKGIKK